MEEQKKVFTSSDDLFSTENLGEEQKKVFTASLFTSSSDVLFTDSGIYISVTAGRPHKMVSQVVSVCCSCHLCPTLLYI